MRIIRTAALLIVAVVILFSAVTVRDAPGTFSASKHNLPYLLPTSAETVTSKDAYLDVITLTNVHASANAKVTVTDRQGSPLKLLNAIDLAPGDTYTQAFNKRYMPSGFTWVSDTASAVVAYAKWSE